MNSSNTMLTTSIGILPIGETDIGFLSSTPSVSTAYPTTSFTTYNITLSTASAWVNTSGGATMTEAQIRAVLANVSFFRIRGEYSSTLDTGYLDDVAIYRP